METNTKMSKSQNVLSLTVLLALQLNWIQGAAVLSQNFVFEKRATDGGTISSAF